MAKIKSWKDISPAKIAPIISWKNIKTPKIKSWKNIKKSGGKIMQGYKAGGKV